MQLTNEFSNRCCHGSGSSGLQHRGVGLAAVCCGVDPCVTTLHESPTKWATRGPDVQPDEAPPVAHFLSDSKLPDAILYKLHSRVCSVVDAVVQQPRRRYSKGIKNGPLPPLSRSANIVPTTQKLAPPNISTCTTSPPFRILR